MPRFRASVQYGDWEGFAAADGADLSSHEIRAILRRDGLIAENEFLIALNMFSGENTDQTVEPVGVTAFVVPGSTYDEAMAFIANERDVEGRIPVREVRLDMDLVAFFACFKRLSITLVNRTMQLSNEEYSVLAR